MGKNINIIENLFMKKIKQYHTFINENSSLQKISEKDLKKLFNDETIIINELSIKNDKNIFLYDLIRLAQGAIVKILNNNISIMLEDGIDFKIIKNIVRRSPLNKEGAMFGMFFETHPDFIP